MARGVQGAILRGLGARDHEATVVETQRLAPHFLRVRLSCARVFEDFEVSPTAWLRFWIPDPDGSDTEFQRGYTLTEADPDAGTFAIDVVLHEPAGPATRWAKDVTAGSTVLVSALGSTTFEVPEEPPAGYLLVGDSASIPAINGIIGAVPDEIPIELYLEQHDPDDLLVALTEHPRMRTHWVPRNGPGALSAAIEERDWSDWHTWAAPEAGTLKHLRTRLRDEFGFPKSEVYARAYWTFGRAMGKYRGKQAEPVVDSPPPPVTIEATGDTALSPAPVEASATSSAPTPPKRWRAQAAGRLLQPLRSTFWIAGIAQTVITVIQLAPFVLLVELARLLLRGAAADRLWDLGILAVVLLGAGALLESVLLLWLHAVDAGFSRRLRHQLLGKLARLPLGWFTARGSGSIKHLVQDDTLSLHYLVTHAVPDAVAAVVAPVAVLTYLFIVDWRIALVMFIPILIYIVVMSAMLVQSGTKPAEAMRWAEKMDGAAAGYLDGQPVIRVFGGATASAFRARLDGYLKFLNDWQRPFIAKKTLIDLVNRPATYLWLITLFGTTLISSGSMPAVDILPFLLLGTAFGSRLLGIGFGLSGIREGMLAARRIQVALDEQELIDADGSTLSSPGAQRGLVEFDDVGFGYRPRVPVVQGISLTLQPGTVTALVGPSGSGKSTLAALLARFHDIGSGSIRVDGRDLRSLTSDELYSTVGFVLQDTQLVHGTVHENIALACPEATSEQVEQAAREAQIHERISRMPQGYDTVLGVDAGLSGGERQRLTIARALLADTDVLVLDEATAYADPESEFHVQQAISALTRDRTVLVIAHRLHTITGADNIVVLDGGRVVDNGTHEELLGRAGRFRDLWDATERTADDDAELGSAR